MSTILTAAGDSLRARLQAEGTALVIDKMIFANVPGQDHTLPIVPGVSVPVEHVVLEYAIPSEYRAFVNPNEVVYSAMLGSDVGDFVFNWQGLYCSEHETLVAVATFPALEKRRYDDATGKTGNNITRNFILAFSGAQELTGLSISADVWQLDFTVRLNGMDERERLSNFDIYGQVFFDGNGWLLLKSDSTYAFQPGLGYVGGIRAALAESLPMVPTLTPCDVWLDVALMPQGSDRVAMVEALLVEVDADVPAVANVAGLTHYHAIVARISANGTVTDLRPKTVGGLTPDKAGAAARTVKIIAGTGIGGGGSLGGDVTLTTEYMWNPVKNYPVPALVFGVDSNLYKSLLLSGPGVSGVGPKEPGASGSEAYWVEYGASIVKPYDIHDTLEYFLCWYPFKGIHPAAKPGMLPLNGYLEPSAAAKYPKAFAYLQTPEGQQLCTTETEWQAARRAHWATLASGEKIGWDSVGGICKYVIDTNAGTIRVPDLRGMYDEVAGFDSLGVGGVHGDGIRNIVGGVHTNVTFSGGTMYANSALINQLTRTGGIHNWGEGGYLSNILLDASKNVPIANKNQPRAWGSLACVYLGIPTS